MNRRLLLGIAASVAAVALPAPALAQLPAPASCGPESLTLASTTASTHFNISKDSLSGTDLSPYVNELEAAYAKQVTDFGWAPPKPPGSGRYRVVVSGSPAGGGHAYTTGTDTATALDNPATAWTETDAATPCLHLASSFASTAARQATIARELNRALLYGIGALTGPVPDTTLTESSLALMEKLSANVDVNVGDLYPAFDDSLGAYDGANPRSQWLALRGLTERFGSGAEDVLQDMWERTSRGESHDLDALDGALSSRGVPLGQAFHDYAIAARAMRNCTQDVLPYCFSDAAAYVAEGGARSDHVQIAAVGDSTGGTVEDDYAIQWIGLPSEPADVTVTNTAPGGTMRATGVCSSGGQPLRVAFPSAAIGAGQSSTIQAFPPSGCGGAAVVLSSSSRTAADPEQSTSRSYTIATAPPTANVTVTTTGDGSGLVASDPGGIFCGVLCSAPFEIGSTITLGAAASKGSTFKGWSGACTGTAALCEVTVTEPEAVTARFDVVTVSPTITVTPTTTPAPVQTVPTDSGTIALASDTTAPRIGLSRLRLSRKLRTLKIRVSCPSAEPHRCSGFVSLTSRAAGKRLNFGQLAFLALRGGSRRTLKFRLTPRSRSAARRVRKLRVSVKSRARDDAFNYASRSRTLTVRVPRKRR